MLVENRSLRRNSFCARLFLSAYAYLSGPAKIIRLTHRAQALGPVLKSAGVAAQQRSGLAAPPPHSPSRVPS